MTVVSDGAGLRNGVTSVSDRAPSVSSVEGQTVSAVVISSATAWYLNAKSLSRTPGESGGADTKTSLTVVVSGAFSGKGVTRVGSGAPRSSSVESQTASAVVVGRTTRRDSNAL